MSRKTKLRTWLRVESWHLTCCIWLVGVSRHSDCEVYMKVKLRGSPYLDVGFAYSDHSEMWLMIGMIA